MTTITDEFGITGAVEFVNVHVGRDNLLYIDPSAIRRAAMSNDKYGLAADKALSNYFDETLKKLRSTVLVTRAIGESDLQHFGELGATRLGMSRRGYSGHGAAAKLGKRIWSELSTNALALHAIATLKYIEDIPLFVHGIDKDVTSDITARIILPVLEQFTQDMVRKHPEFTSGRSTAQLTTSVWDEISLSWIPHTLTLPVADGKPLLLVPKNIVNFKIQMTYGQYYQVAVLEHVKWERVVEVTRKRQTVLKPQFNKKQLQTQPGLSQSRRNSTAQTARIYETFQTDVLGDYRTKRQTSFVPLSDAQLTFYIEREPKTASAPLT